MRARRVGIRFALADRSALVRGDCSGLDVVPQDAFMDQAVKILLEARRTMQPGLPIGDLIGEPRLENAYRIQRRIVEALAVAGDPTVGRKIGVTAAAARQAMGIEEPLWGSLTRNSRLDSGSVIPRDRFFLPRVEVEVAFELGEGIETIAPAATALPEAIHRAHAAIEVVDSRLAMAERDPAVMVADNVGLGYFVIGDGRRAEGIDFAGLQMELSADGQRVATGKGADCHGSPLHSLAWLVERMRALGTPLQPGDWVMSGSLAPMVPARPGQNFRGNITGLGTVEVGFAHD